MATRYYVNSITVPPGTLATAPQITTWQIEDAILARIELDIPNGHNGQTGIRVLRSQQQVIPWSNNQYLVANARLLSVDYGLELTESKLVVHTINADVFAHTFYLRATITDLPLPTSSGSSAPPIVASALLVGPAVPLPQAAGG